MWIGLVCVLFVMACTKQAQPTSSMPDSKSMVQAPPQASASQPVSTSADKAAQDISGSVSEVDSLQQDTGTDDLNNMDQDLAAVDSADWN